MKKISYLLCSIIILILLNTVCIMAGGTQESDTGGTKEYPFTNKTLLELISKHKDLSFISGALEKTGLADQIAGLEGYTLFLPTDDVVARLHESVRNAMENDPAVLLEILTDQMVKGVLSLENLKNLSSVTTMGGVYMPIEWSKGTITLSNSDLIKTNLFGNGFVVHIVTGIIVSGVTLKN